MGLAGAPVIGWHEQGRRLTRGAVLCYLMELTEGMEMDYYTNEQMDGMPILPPASPKERDDFAKQHPELWAELLQLFMPIDNGFAMQTRGKEIGEFVLRWKARE